MTLAAGTRLECVQPDIGVSPDPARALLVASHLEKRYFDRLAVEDVSFEVRRGEVVALLGPNGAGKTTTLRLLAGLLRPTAGSVAVDGVTQTARAWTSTRARLGFLTETPGLWDRLTVESNLLTFARLYGLHDAGARVRSLLGDFGLADRASDTAGTLSKGMRQKVALARALLHDPTIVLLDEPTAGLDPAMTRTVRDLVVRLRRDGRGVLLSTHSLDEAERTADRIVVINRTVVAFDTPAALRSRWKSGRVVIRLAGSAAPFVAVVRSAGVRDVVADGSTLRCAPDPATGVTPAVIRALVSAGADIEAVIPDETTLEDAYLALTGEHPGRAGERRTS
jgi:ABC-2 type transport system ATP-binding protein